MSGMKTGGDDDSIVELPQLLRGIQDGAFWGRGSGETRDYGFDPRAIKRNIQTLHHQLPRHRCTFGSLRQLRFLCCNWTSAGFHLL